ncbi:hypothetical protein M378DRAFT_158014 [Amanita muscaria Koide BX008]|uniref:Uncharacterized protein n=1 Tax=Amanita muscaria (strain Koide BX008) TaxID=946122 RepID=A0A0C2XIR3_AMAMK|nr:hypothetical protein M378DRAFT_158014 [Amanita muscaria Koide BX008]
MIPFRVTSAAHHANASPSVTLEKGDYRLRAPRTSRPSPPTPANRATRLRSASRSQSHARINLTLLILLLVVACLFCFGAAYHIYSTRWDTRYLVHPVSLTDMAQVREPLHDEGPVISDPHEKFMGYFPHSGFHNQRIALENALVLSALLNRTLIVPPVRLGKKPISYVNYESLMTSLVLSGKEGLHHCSTIPPHMNLPLECLDFFDYTHVSWNWIVDIPKYINGRPLIYQRGVSPYWIRDRLQLNETDILVLSDESRYQFQYHDTPVTVSDSRTSKYMEQIYVSDIAQSKKRLLQFGTLFGSSRLVLTNRDNIGIRTAIRRNMAFSNPVLVSVVDQIRDDIGIPYLGAHIRMSDGLFEQNLAFNMRNVWQKLVQAPYGHDLSELGFALNTSFFPKLSSSMPRRTSSTCLEQLHHADLSVPLFIATDAESLSHEVLLSTFSMTFTCILFISNFATQVEPLNHIRNVDDGLHLGPFLVPFLDAMVLGHAAKVATTEGSTFSSFIEDVLWKVYHGQEISQRGMS